MNGRRPGRPQSAQHSMSANNHQQTNIFDEDRQQLNFAEICNALYERELIYLSKQTNLDILKRRLAGLSHHIKKAAEYLLSDQSPLSVDVHNASWHFKQQAKCPTPKRDSQVKWFAENAHAGIPIPVYVFNKGIEHIELDSVDRMDLAGNKLHLNKQGWFTFGGLPVNTEDTSLHKKRMLKPGKYSMSAACCGHSWNHKGKTQPRALSLRELMLTTVINWKTFC